MSTKQTGKTVKVAVKKPVTQPKMSGDDVASKVMVTPRKHVTKTAVLSNKDTVKVRKSHTGTTSATKRPTCPSGQLPVVAGDTIDETQEESKPDESMKAEDPKAGDKLPDSQIKVGKESVTMTCYVPQPVTVQTHVDTKEVPQPVEPLGCGGVGVSEPMDVQSSETQKPPETEPETPLDRSSESQPLTGVETQRGEPLPELQTPSEDTCTQNPQTNIGGPEPVGSSVLLKPESGTEEVKIKTEPETRAEHMETKTRETEAKTEEVKTRKVEPGTNTEEQWNRAGSSQIQQQATRRAAKEMEEDLPSGGVKSTQEGLSGSIGSTCCVRSVVLFSLLPW